MNDRHKLESTLINELKKAQTQLAQDSSTSEMMNKIREIYHDDSQGFMQSVGMAEASKSTKAVKPNLPESKIPDLIYLLDAVSKNQQNKPSRNSHLPSPDSSLKNYLHSDSNLSPDTLINKSNEEQLMQINQLQSEIDKLQKILQFLIQEKQAIQQHHGKYAKPAERLKAQRLLRELPGVISHKQNQIKELYQDQ